MSKVHKTVRLEEETFKRLEQLKQDGESDSAVIIRALEAGLSSLEVEPEQRADDMPEESSGDYSRLIDALEAHVASLTAEVDTYRRQLEVKDAQITSLTEVTKGAQLLHGLSEQKALEDTQTKEKRGFFSRLFS